MKSNKKAFRRRLEFRRSRGGFVGFRGYNHPYRSKITQTIKIPTIGIGSGKDCDGQILVWSDMLGFFDSFKPKFVREYLKGKELVQNAIKQYADDVKKGNFPNELESYH